MMHTSLPRLGYRVFQLRKTLRERDGVVPRDFVEARLDEAGRTLFYSQTRRDQVHAARAAVLLADSHPNEETLIVAALLHDVGKGDQRIWQRVLYVVLNAVSTTLLRRIARSGPGWRGALNRSQRHAELSAELASSAGVGEAVVRLIAEHHQLAIAKDQLLLQWADEVA